MTSEKRKPYYPTLKEGDRIKFNTQTDVHSLGFALHQDGWRYRVSNNHIVLVGRKEEKIK